MNDPIERMNAAIERKIDEWDKLQDGVPDGSFRCPECNCIVPGEPIAVSEHPDSPVCCFDCLSSDLKAGYVRAFAPISFDVSEVLQ